MAVDKTLRDIEPVHAPNNGVSAARPLIAVPEALPALLPPPPVLPVAKIHSDQSPRQVAKRLTAAMAAQEGEPPALTPEALFEMMMNHATRKGGGDGGGGGDSEGPPPKTLLGFDAKHWAGSTVKALLAGVAFLVLWYNTVNEGLAGRPTFEEVDEGIIEALEVVDASLGSHETNGTHPAIETRLEDHGEQIRLIRDSQIRAEGIDKAQTEVLKEIKEDLRFMRRPNRRRDED